MDDRFKHHPPKDSTIVNAHQGIRQASDDYLKAINSYCVDSYEKSIAITKLEEAMMWSNAAIARNQ